MLRPALFALPCFAAFLVGCGSDDLQAPKPQPAPEVVTIAKARTLTAGTYTQVEGFVTVPPATFFSSTGDAGFGLQDATGGIYVSLFDLVKAPLGTKLRVIGQIIDVSQQTVLYTNNTGLEGVDMPQMISPRDVKTGEVGESTEGQLVRIKGTVSKAIVDEKPYGLRSFVDDGSGEVRIYICLGVKDVPLIDDTMLTPGTSVEITGFAQQYGADYEIAPRMASDLVLP